MQLSTAKADTAFLPLAQWVNTDIGTTPAAGSGSFNATAGTYTIAGSGADIWNTADSFHFSYHPLHGDGDIVARVQSQVNTHVWAKAGVMLRESTAAGSKYVAMLVTPTAGCGLQYRSTTSGSSTNAWTSGLTAPRWLKLERRGNLVSGYQSVDGVTWTLVRCVNLPLSADLLVGLAACSHVTTATLSTAVVDQVQVTPVSAATSLPWPWTESAIGQATDQGVSLFDGSYLLANLGADIAATADRCKFVNRTLIGDGSLVVKVAENGSSTAWTRFGLMMRDTLEANAKNVLLHFATVNNGLIFQSRQTVGGTTGTRAPAVAKAPPLWLKLERSGDVFTASYSEDGVQWTVQGTEAIAMGSSIQVGLAFSNPSTSVWAFGVGDQLKLVTPADQDGNGLADVWEVTHFGRTGVDPSAASEGDGHTTAQKWAEDTLSASQQGWSAAYYPSADHSVAPLWQRGDATIDFTWSAGTEPITGLGSANYSVHWQGFVQPLADETYTFTAVSSGAVRLRVNGQTVIDRDALATAEPVVSLPVTLLASKPTQIDVDYVNASSDGRIQVRWSSASLPDAVLAATAVVPTDATDTNSDGLPDSWAVANGFNPSDATLATQDTDQDGLPNLIEYQLGTDPHQDNGRIPGKVVLEEWRGITGATIADLTNSPRFQTAPDAVSLLTALQTTPSRGDNYGDRVRGYLQAPVEGDYTFWVAGDDDVELWLSPSERPCDRQKIAKTSGRTAAQAYELAASQRSGSIHLLAGQSYYFEVLFKESLSLDGFSVAWTRPGTVRKVISAPYLASFHPSDDDLDGNGLPDAWELKYFGHTNVNPYADADGDGVSNLAEYQLGIDPSKADTDGDGLSDSLERHAGTDPTHADRVDPTLAPWSISSIGSVSVLSGITHGNTASLWLSGLDKGLVTSGDAFRFLNQTIPGDFDLAVAVKETDGTAGNFGLVVRAGTTVKAPTVCFNFSGGKYYFCYRAAENGPLHQNAYSQGFGLPPSANGYWLRLRRQGSLISAYYSDDGTTWTYFTGVQQALPTSVQVGMATWTSSKTLAIREVTQLRLRFDTDGDGLFDDQEALLGTDPTKIDTNGNGLSDYEESINVGSDAAGVGVAPVEVATYSALAGVPVKGTWTPHTSGLYLETPLGSVDYALEVPTDGIYLLQLDVTCQSNATSYFYFPFEFSVDGQFVERVETPLPVGALGNVTTTLPWLTAGQHTVRVFFDNTLTYRTIALNTLHLRSVGGSDADENGRPDWVDRRLAGHNRLFEPKPFSYVSPLCVQGLTRYPGLMGLRANGAAIIPQTAPNSGWFTDVPLQENTPTAIEAVFENAAVRSQASVVWTPLNLLAATPVGSLTVRLNDRLLLASRPEDETLAGGSSSLSIAKAGTSVLRQVLGSGPTDTLSYQFTQAGSYTVSASYLVGGYAQTGTLTVTVVDTAFNGSPWVGLNFPYVWKNPKISSAVGVVSETAVVLDQVTALSPAGYQFRTVSQNLLPHPVVARLGEAGPITARTQINTLRVNSDSETSADVVATYPDGTRLMGTPLFVSAVPAGLRVEVQIIVQGVTFQDGTTRKVLQAADFDSIGRAYLTFVYPPNLKSSYCHRSYVYVDSAYLGAL